MGIFLFRRRKSGCAVLGGALLWVALAVLPAHAQDMPAERQAMVREVAAMARTFGGGAIEPRVLDALNRVPRHEFVSALLRPYAYDNRPLPIGHGQTISQPYIVAAMTDLLKVGAGGTAQPDRPSNSTALPDRAGNWTAQPDRAGNWTALEIGTGSGYQAAVLAELGARVFTIEIVEPLALEAAARLKRLGYAGIATRVGDGYHGWPERGPFDAIVVTAAASHVPPPLVQQLKPGGRMAIPVGSQFLTQQLMVVEKHADGTVTTRQVMPVRFVPLTGGHQ